MRTLLFAPILLAVASTGLAAASPPAYSFVATTPCRQYNSLSDAPLPQGVNRTVTLTGTPCNIPAGAAAVTANITIFNITGATGNGVFKVDTVSPPASAWINYPASEAQRANAGTVALNASGQIIVQVAQGAGQVDFVVDVNGYETADLGNFNTFVGVNAGKSTTTSAGNTAVGANALPNITTGFLSTCIGSGALQNSTGGINIAVGAGAGSNVLLGLGNLYVGTAGANENQTLRIGSGQIATFIAGISGATSAAGVGVLVNASGKLGTTTSSARFKENIRDMGDRSAGLFQLRPVTFRYKPEIDPSGLPQYGLVAEEVARVYPDLVTCDDAGQEQTVRYHFLVPMLLNEVQKSHRTLDERSAVLRDLKQRLDRLEALLSAR